MRKDSSRRSAKRGGHSTNERFNAYRRDNRGEDGRISDRLDAIRHLFCAEKTAALADAALSLAIVPRPDGHFGSVPIDFTVAEQPHVVNESIRGKLDTRRPAMLVSQAMTGSRIARKCQSQRRGGYANDV